MVKILDFSCARNYWQKIIMHIKIASFLTDCRSVTIGRNIVLLIQNSLWKTFFF